MPGDARHRGRGVRRRTLQSVEPADGAQRGRSGQMRRRSRKLVRHAGPIAMERDSILAPPTAEGP